MLGDASLALLDLLQAGGTYTLSRLYSSLFPKSTRVAASFRSRLQYLKTAGYICGSARQGYQLTDRGESRLERLSFTRLRCQGRWDGIWRVIAFDIPESNRAARYMVRHLIRQLGCRQLQRSVWVHPLPCLQQFKDIQTAYGVKDHLRLMEVNWMSGQDKLLRVFRKQYPLL